MFIVIEIEIKKEETRDRGFRYYSNVEVEPTVTAAELTQIVTQRVSTDRQINVATCKLYHGKKEITEGWVYSMKYPVKAKIVQQ